MPGKPGFKYVYSPSHINKVLEKIQQTGRPDQLTMPYLKQTWLLKNTQYSAVLDLLKDMGFLDSSGIPMPLYAEYQNPVKAGQALAKGIRNAYTDLFKAYPDAYNLSQETLEGYIKQQTGAEKSILRKTSATFRRLCSLAEFGAEESPHVSKMEDTKPEPSSPPSESFIPISMNIQIVIPSDATEEQYDRIFSSLKKFLGK
jgi:hypothetical protein